MPFSAETTTKYTHNLHSKLCLSTTIPLELQAQDKLANLRWTLVLAIIDYLAKNPHKPEGSNMPI